MAIKSATTIENAPYILAVGGENTAVIYAACTELNDLINELKNYYLFYRMSDKSVTVQMANSYMRLVLAELDKIKEEVLAAYGYELFTSESQDYRTNTNWNSAKMANELSEYRERLLLTLSDVFKLQKMQGIRIVFYEIYLNQAITLYEFDSENT